MHRALLCFTLITICPALLHAGHPKQFGLPALPRTDFNRLATRANLPLFWVKDANENGLLEPGELAATGAGKVLAGYVARGKFTPRLVKAYKALVELRRHEAVAKELDGGRPTLVQTDLSGAPAQDKAVVRNVLAAAKIIEGLYLRQTGAAKHQAWLRRADPASKTLFWRNHGPWCVSPVASKDPFCSGHPAFPLRRSEAYPQDGPQDDAMCKRLRAQPNAKALLDPFTVVRKLRGGKLSASPLNKVFGAQMRQVAAKLRSAARAVAADPAEKAFHRYLLAAADGFKTNSWGEADEAWAAMNSANSKWYLRIAPDEVYFDPCQQKAGFHVSFARIDKASVAWQQKLTPLRAAMERALAKHIGKPYVARQVRFHMPDFIQIVINAGDARHPLGATIGQSLPNWGKVAQEGRGRTVVMSNLYTDPDSKRIDQTKARSLLSKATMAHYTQTPDPQLLNIILHEASHNFGPHSDYKIKGRSPKEIFGGKLASTLEELKAQTGGLWYLQLLRRRGLIDDKVLKQAYLKAITWAFSHISRGMFTPGGNVRPYSQLAAVQIGTFLKEGALTYRRGKYTIHFDKLPGSINKLMKRVGQLKARGDAAGARALIDHFVKGKGSRLVRQPRIARTLLRYSKATFLYSVVY
jgi:hypothetical protein